MRKGRRSVLMTLGYSLKELEDLYFKYGTYKKLSQVTGISVSTLSKYLKNLSRSIPIQHEDKAFEKLARWVKEHPDAKLPNNPEKIARLVGIDEPAAVDWLSKRKQRALNRLKYTITRTLREDTWVVDSRYRKIPVKAIKRLVIPKRLDYSPMVFVDVWLKTGEHVQVPFNVHRR
jgi:transcriptional regulator with XRE-family HTH domain